MIQGNKERKCRIQSSNKINTQKCSESQPDEMTFHRNTSCKVVYRISHAFKKALILLLFDNIILQDFTLYDYSRLTKMVLMSFLPLSKWMSLTFNFLIFNIVTTTNISIRHGRDL